MEHKVESIRVGGKGYAMDFVLTGSKAGQKACTRIFRVLGKPERDVDVEMTIDGQPWSAVYGPSDAPKTVTRGGNSFRVSHECKKIVRVRKGCST
jgi:hypothetical protein